MGAPAKKKRRPSIASRELTTPRVASNPIKAIANWGASSREYAISRSVGTRAGALESFNGRSTLRDPEGKLHRPLRLRSLGIVCKGCAGGRRCEQFKMRTRVKFMIQTTLGSPSRVFALCLTGRVAIETSSSQGPS